MVIMLMNARVGGNNAHTMDVVTSLKDALVKITTDQVCRGGLPKMKKRERRLHAL